MKTIQLTQGKVALVDDIDFEHLNNHKWHAAKTHRGTYYAARKIRLADGKQGTIFMHREVLGLNQGDPNCDHKNHNELDNRRDNLRRCTPLQNMQNQRPHRNGSSAFKGVCWNKKREKWQVQIRWEGHKKHLGYFDNEIEAAMAYDIVAVRYFGEFASLNFSKRSA